MKALRILEVNVIDSKTVYFKFSANLANDIGIDNIIISPLSDSVPTPEIKNLLVNGNSLELTLQPLTPFAVYNFKFISTDDVIFKSSDGTQIIFQNGILNVAKVLGPIEPENPIKKTAGLFLSGNIYTSDISSVIGSNIQVNSKIFSKALYDIRQNRNENFISFTVEDEEKTRGNGPFDRLNEEGAYEILRVGLNKTGTKLTGSISYDEFPSYVINLQQTLYSEELEAGHTNNSGIFNIDSLILNLTKSPIIKLKALTFTYSTSPFIYEYPVTTLGYQITNSKYDPDYAFSYATLESNQIKLSARVLEDANFSLTNIVKITAEYYYKDIGKWIDPNTVKITTLFSSVREVLPPIENVFNLKHSPIVTLNDEIPTLNGVTFIDPNTLESLSIKHPAFKYELKFRQDYLPSKIGEYAIDYENGTVYCWGEDGYNWGTGSYPPLATYYYRNVFKEDIDYTIDGYTYDVVALPESILVGGSASILFDYEYTLTKLIDYNENVHKESLQERVENRLLSLGSIKTKYGPITDVFKLYNETNGEQYNIVRWTDDTIYFTSLIQPNILNAPNEWINWKLSANEVLLVSDKLTSTIPFTYIFEINLANTNIISNTGDGIGWKWNTSLIFNKPEIFIQEKYWDTLFSLAVNLNKLTTIGDYVVDYRSGIIYLLVGSTQDFNIGNVSYKYGHIDPQNPHVLTVNNIYNQILPGTPPEKTYTYSKIIDDDITVSSFINTGERDYNGLPYYYSSADGYVIGTIGDSGFVAGVQNNIQSIKSIYELTDANNNQLPINFASFATFEEKTITVNPYIHQEYLSVAQNGSGQKYIDVSIPWYYQSPNITYTISIIRVSDSQELWDNTGTITLGAVPRLIIPNTFTPMIGDSVILTITWELNALSQVIVDYNRGALYVDYTYLKDEILVSYEYGDNYIDFREYDTLDTGKKYYVSYKCGALRNALLRNFATLTNIDILNTLDVNFNRERYRDAIKAVFESTGQGPTIPLIKNITKNITHIDPEIIEAYLLNWNLGISYLYKNAPKTTGEFENVGGKFSNGALINKSDQTINLPMSSALRLNQGTWENWITPQWDGLDNDANIYVRATKNSTELEEVSIFIGGSEYHPDYTSIDGQNWVKLNKLDNVLGEPNKNKSGLFIYMNKDSGDTNRWYFDVVDGYNDGYVPGLDGYASNLWQVSFKTDGKIYDVKDYLTQDTTLTSGSSTWKWKFTTDGYTTYGLTCLADYNHYIFDAGNSISKNRISLFKDPSGYLNFRVIDKDGIISTVSANISSWKRGEKYFVGTAWNINTPNHQDELHLFVDGKEVENIIKYGIPTNPYLHQKWRTISDEEFVGVTSYNIISGFDLVTTLGSNIVTSSTNFTTNGIVPGNTLLIDESGFNPSGYTITGVSGQQLTLSATMPATLSDAKWTVNPTNITVSTEIDIYPNWIVKTIHSSLTGTCTTISGNDTISSATNFISNGVSAGYYIRIVDPGFEKFYTILSVETNALVLNDSMPSSGSYTFFIYEPTENELYGLRAQYPDYDFNEVNNENIVTLKNNVLANDIILVKPLGINHIRNKKKFFVWGTASNKIKTYLDAPINMNKVNIIHYNVIPTNIGPSNGTISLGILTSTITDISAPTNIVGGRKLSVKISGSNIDWSTPITVTINGSSTEVLTFTSESTINTTNAFTSITSVVVVVKPINTTKNACVLQVTEDRSILIPNNIGDTYPVLKYSYSIKQGQFLYGSGNSVSEDTLFSDLYINNYLHIKQPLSVAGYYLINSISADRKTLVLDTPVPTTFTNGKYEILDTTTDGSGFQNGYFVLEKNTTPGDPYMLPEGTYEVEYFSYLSIPFDNITNEKIWIGSSINGDEQVNAILDEVRISSEKLTDVRVGETAVAPTRSITKDYNSLKEIASNKWTLTSLRFNSYPFVNDTDYYKIGDKSWILSGQGVNSEFGPSIYLIDKPFIKENEGILNTSTSGTIEFWVSPIWETWNDPSYRYYFDATSLISEDVVSSSNTVVKPSAGVSQILSITDLSGKDYSVGAIYSNGEIKLAQRLPSQNFKLQLNYVQSGTYGDRLSIFKDPSGYLNFKVTAYGVDHVVRAPVLWRRNTWHRIKCQWKFNTGADYVKLFIDGFERGSMTVSKNLTLGGLTAGGSFAGYGKATVNKIQFKDKINWMFIGSDYLSNNICNAQLNNMRFTNIARNLYSPFGESIDVAWNSNTENAHPVTEDLYTTWILDFDNIFEKIENFAFIKYENGGWNDFYLKVFDEFKYLEENTKSKEIFEILISLFKPANSRAFIQYL